MSTLSLFIFGPSKIFNLPDTTSYTIAGVSLLGMSISGYFVPGLCLIISTIEKEYNLDKDNQSLNDRASGLLSTAMAMGCIIGPVLGGVLNDKVGFRSTCDTLGFLTFVFALFYFFSIILPHLCSKRRSRPVIAIEALDIVIDSHDSFSSKETKIEEFELSKHNNRNKLNLQVAIPHRKMSETSEPGTAASTK